LFLPAAQFQRHFCTSELSLESLVEACGEQGIPLGGGFDLQMLQRVHPRPQRVQLGNNPARRGGLKARPVKAWGEAPGKRPKLNFSALKGWDIVAE
jgi:hypothetical protein